MTEFVWVLLDIIKHTWDVTTRYACSIERYPSRKHFKSRFLALNVPRRNELVATDTVYSDTPAVNSGATSAQVFIGTQTLVTDVYGMKSDKEFVYTLEDNIRKRGAMDKLISDRAQVEISNKVLDILGNYVIEDWQSEPYHEHQNTAERHYQTLKAGTNRVLDRTGAPACCWLLARSMYAMYSTMSHQKPSVGKRHCQYLLKCSLSLLTSLTTSVLSTIPSKDSSPVFRPR